MSCTTTTTAAAAAPYRALVVRRLSGQQMCFACGCSPTSCLVPRRLAHRSHSTSSQPPALGCWLPDRCMTVPGTDVRSGCLVHLCGRKRSRARYVHVVAGHCPPSRAIVPPTGVPDRGAPKNRSRDTLRISREPLQTEEHNLGGIDSSSAHTLWFGRRGTGLLPTRDLKSAGREAVRVRLPPALLNRNRP